MSTTTSRPTRRTIARGAAWAVPVVAVGAAAPALAASGCTSLPPFSTANGWTLTTAGTPRNGTGDVGFFNGTFDMTLDAQSNASFSATASHSLAVVAGRTYTFTYSYTAFTGNRVALTQSLLVNGTVIAGSTFTTDTSGSSGSRVVTYVAPATATVTFAVRNSVTSPPGITDGDDMTTGAITVTCS